MPSALIVYSYCAVVVVVVVLVVVVAAGQVERLVAGDDDVVVWGRPTALRWALGCARGRYPDR